jgi:hypothetical protein
MGQMAEKSSFRRLDEKFGRNSFLYLDTYKSCDLIGYKDKSPRPIKVFLIRSHDYEKLSASWPTSDEWENNRSRRDQLWVTDEADIRVIWLSSSQQNNVN